jgi:hypothetical protein
MSLPHATRPKEGASPRSTRQLLDELDALMDQMLALPVEDEPSEEPPAVPAPALAATLTMIEPETAPLPKEMALQESKAAPPLRSSRKNRNVAKEDEGDAGAPPWTDGHFQVEHEEKASKSAESFALVDLNDDAATDALLTADKPAPQPAPVAPRREAARPLPPSSASWTYGALVVWDRAFRRLTRRLGPIGWLLRTAGGRVILGALGLAFWIVSLAWLIHDWLRWTR